MPPRRGTDREFSVKGANDDVEGASVFVRTHRTCWLSSQRQLPALRAVQYGVQYCVSGKEGDRIRQFSDMLRSTATVVVRAWVGPARVRGSCADAALDPQTQFSAHQWPNPGQGQVGRPGRRDEPPRARADVRPLGVSGRQEQGGGASVLPGGAR